MVAAATDPHALRTAAADVATGRNLFISVAEQFVKNGLRDAGYT